MTHTRAHAQRVPRALQPLMPPAPVLPVEDELADAPPWLTVYADEEEDGSPDELLMEPSQAPQQREGGRSLGW